MSPIGMLGVALVLGSVSGAPAQSSPPTSSYLVFVASEAADQVALIRFGPKGALIEHRTALKLVPGDPAGQPDVFVALDGRSYVLKSAHGLPDSELVTAPRSIAIATNGRSYLVATAHGFANGELLRLQIAADSSIRESQPPDTLQGREPLGGLPGTVRVTPDGDYAWVGVSDLRAGNTTSWISVVYLASMVEVARIETCAASAGAGFTGDGSKYYTVCRRASTLVEIDANTMKPGRALALSATGRECAPTSVEPDATGSRLFVVCSGSDDVMEVDLASWAVGRRLAPGVGIEHLAMTRDGKLMVATSTRLGAVVVIDLASGRELARLPTTHPGPGSLAISPDSRFAFVSVTGGPADPGTVEVFDLAALRHAAVIDVGAMPGGIGFWKMEGPKP